MGRLISTLVLILSLSCVTFAQLIVDKGIYRANFSNNFHESNYVSYYLYKGGGSCDRTNLHFTNDDPRLQCATDADYIGSHYDKCSLGFRQLSQNPQFSVSYFSPK